MQQQVLNQQSYSDVLFFLFWFILDQVRHVVPVEKKSQTDKSYLLFSAVRVQYAETTPGGRDCDASGNEWE